jgi:hypothetical protein
VWYPYHTTICIRETSMNLVETVTYLSTVSPERSKWVWNINIKVMDNGKTSVNANPIPWMKIEDALPMGVKVVVTVDDKRALEHWQSRCRMARSYRHAGFSWEKAEEHLKLMRKVVHKTV